MFTQVDISAASQALQPPSSEFEQTELLRQILSVQNRNNTLLEELARTMSAAHKQRATELNQWKQANPELAHNCREAAEALSRVQVEYLENITEEINSTSDCLMEGEFMLNEFIDRFGPRLAHLNGMIQVLAQLSSVSNPTGAAP
jgi:hypothetical protein